MLTSRYPGDDFEKMFAAKESPKMYKVKWDSRKLNHHLVQPRDHACTLHVGHVDSLTSTLGVGCPETSLLAAQQLRRVGSIVVARME